MSNNTSFDWKTEEEGWHNAPAGDPPPTTPTKWPRYLSLIAIILIAIGLVAYLLLNTRVNTVSTALEEEVLGTHQLVQEAIAQQDEELFEVYLDKRSQTVLWSISQRQALQAQTTWERNQYGFFTTESPLSEPTIEMSADLTRAEIEFEQTYQVTRPDGTLTTTTLLHTAHYRQNHDDRWLYTDASDTFWGDTLTFKGNYLTLEYPARDQAIAQQLAGDIETALAISCEERACEAITLTLSTEPETLLASIDLDYFFTLEIDLPTITLLGYPLDEVGYNNLYRHYLIAALIQTAHQRNDLANWWSNSDTLAQIGLLEWPRDVAEATSYEGGASNLAVSCPAGSHFELWHYNQATQQWSSLLDNQPISMVYPNYAPAGGGLIIQQETPDGSRLSIWQNGESRTLWETPLQPNQSLWLANNSPDERYWAVSVQEEPDEETNAWVQPTFFVIDSAECDPAGCQAHTIPGYPKWSPDGQYTLIEQFAEGPPTLWLGDPAGQNLEEPQEGWSGTWLNSQTYLYRNSSHTVYAATIDDPTPYTYISLDDVEALLPHTNNNNWSISGIQPQDNGTLFISIFFYDPTSSNFNTQQRHNIQLTVDPTWQPQDETPPGEFTYLGEEEHYIPWGNRKQTINNWSVTQIRTATNYRITLTHPTQSPQTYLYSHLLPFNVSQPQFYIPPAENHLLVTQLGLLHFIDPQQNTQQTLAMPSYNCQFAGWLE